MIKKIGYFNCTRYWQKYVFNNLPNGYIGNRVKDIPFHLFKTKNQILLNTKWVLPFQYFDIFHTYNSIIPINKPWVVEIESLLPRYGHIDENDKLFNWGVKRLKHNSCKALIFTSEYTKSMNQINFEKWEIADKGHVIYRAVETFPSLILGSESEFHILFVGNAFYRKGGIELLKALDRITNKDIKITIVSNFEIDWAILPTNEEKIWVQEKILKDKRISVFSHLPHEQIVKLMRQANVFIGTTYADSFNNTILEAMACGLPIISTDIRAIPEMVNEGINGFMISPNKENKNILIDFLEDKILFFINNLSECKKMGSKSFEIAEEKFTLKSRNLKLKNVYDKILDIQS